MRGKHEKIDSVSVIIPTLNRCSTLPRALNSVLSQTFLPNEIIVVDNGSNDGTATMIKEKYPSIKLLCEPKVGVSAARNTGIFNSNGTFIALLDSDDSWFPLKLEKQIEKLRKSKTRIVHTNEVWFKNGKQVNQRKKHKKRGGNIFFDCLPLCCISPSSVLIRKRLFDDVGKFDENLPVCEDYDFWLRVSCQEEISFIEEPLTIKYGGHDDQLSKKYWGMDRFRVKAIEKLLLSNNLNSAQKNAVKNILTEKLNILITGAKKRHNKNCFEIYSKKLERLEELFCESSKVKGAQTDGTNGCYPLGCGT